MIKIEKLSGFILAIFMLFSCGQEKTREELLTDDKVKLSEAIDGYKVNKYKFLKICIRSFRLEDTTMTEFVKFKEETDATMNLLMNMDVEESVSVTDCIKLYRAYSRMSKVLEKTDEDVFPLAIESLALLYKDSAKQVAPLMKGEEKAFYQSVEHSVLSALTSINMGQDIALYEASKTNTQLLPKSEEKALLSYFRSLLFIQHGLYYLAEVELNSNIAWLESGKKVNLPVTRSFFDWGNLQNRQVYDGFHAMNYLVRGLDRLSMPREIDNELGLDDLEVFLTDAEKMNLQNELVWGIEAFFYLKRDQPDKAIVALKKMQTSQILSSDEQVVISKSITYLKNRETSNVLSSTYDKVFITKVALKYIFLTAEKVNWEKVLKDNNVPHAKDVIAMFNKMKVVNDKIELYTDEQIIDDVTEDLKEKGSELFDKAKEIL